MAQYPLVNVYRGFVREAFAIDTRVEESTYPTASTSARCDPLHRDCREMAVVRLHDAWARFCRELILRSAYQPTISTSGTVTSPVPSVRTTAAGIAVWANSFKKKKPVGWEPRWGDPTTALDAASRIGIANLASISPGLSLTPTPIEEIRQVRNFLAHRSQDGARDVGAIAVRIGRSRHTDVHDLVLSYVPPGERLFTSWVRGLQTMAFVAVQ